MKLLRLSLTLRIQEKALSVAPIHLNAVLQKNQPLKEIDKRPFLNNNVLKINFGDDKIVIKKAESIENEQRKLIMKHTTNLFKNPKTLFDLLDIMEYKERGGSSTMEDIAKMLKDENFDLNLLSDRQVALIFRASGDLASYCNSEYKDRFTNKYFNILKARDVKFGIRGLNSFFKTKLENGNPLSVGEFYELLSKYEIEPDVETFEILGDYFAKKGDSKNVYDLISSMKEIDLPPTIKMFSALVESLVISNQVEKARTVILSFENKRILSNIKDLKLAFIKGLAESGKYDILYKEVKEFIDGSVLSKSRVNYLLLEPLALFANATDDVEQIKNIKQLIPPINLKESGNYLDTDLQKFYSKCCDLIENKKIGEASILLDVLPQSFKERSEKSIMNSLNEIILDESDNNSILEDVTLLKEYNIMENPFISLLTRNDGNNKNIFFEIFGKFMETDEYKALKDRFFVTKANIMYLMNQFNEAQRESEKVDIVCKALKSIIDCNLKELNECEKRQLLRLRSSFFNLIIGENFNLIEKITDNLSFQQNSIFLRTLVRMLLNSKKYGDLQDVLNIILQGRLYLSTSEHLLTIIQGILNNKNSDKSTTLTCCSILSCACHSKLKAYNRNAIINVLTNVFSNIHISDESLSLMVDQLVSEKRIIFTRDEKNQLSKLLDSQGLVSRKQYLEMLTEKSSTLLRWLGIKDIRVLEKELLHLEGHENEKAKEAAGFLRTIILEKYINETPLNYEAIFEHLKRVYAFDNKNNIRKVQHTPSLLMRSLVHDNKNNLADDLWEINGVKLDTYALLLYAFNLFIRNETDKLDKILDFVKYDVRVIDDNTMTMMSTFIPEVEEEKLQKFIEIIVQSFNVSESVANKMTLNFHQNTFERLMNENKLEEAFEIAKVIGSINEMPYGQIDIMSASIKSSNTKLFGDVLNWVKSLLNNDTIYIDASLALLENGKQELAENTLKNFPYMMMSEKRLNFIISREKKLKNVDVLKFILKFISQKEWVTDEMINNTLSAILEIYKEQGLVPEIFKFKETLVKEKFPFTAKADLLFREYS
uniref:Leucine-rich PPR motif-containing protein, mitochondrial n=1 Tax=Strongyloides venezuelensis TaxID=75913 RepID=A0A0K0FP05_STRVS